MADDVLDAAAGGDSNKRKYDDSPSPVTRRATGFSSAPDAAAPPSFSSVPPPMNEIELAKQKAQLIAAKLLSDSSDPTKRARVENVGNGGRGFDSSDYGSQKSSGYGLGGAPAASSGYPGGGGPSKRIEIPNGRVGVIIGKGGETIKYLQIQSGAKIQVTRDVDADPNSATRGVDLMGTPDQIAKAEQLVHDVLAEAEAGGSGSGSRRMGGQSSGAEQFSMKIPNNKVGLVIGKGGETIKSMQQQTGARIQVIPLHLPPGDLSQERTVQIDGTSEQIEAAKQLVDEVISEAMETKIGEVHDVSVVAPPETAKDMSQVESLNQSVDEMFIQVDQLEQKLEEVEQFYSNSNTKNPSTPRGGSLVKDKEKEKFPSSSFKKRRQDAASTRAAANQRMQELMRQFGTIMRQITQHHWAGPFMQPVDVVGLGLHDYYEVIEKPMDFSTIKCKMEAKDGTGYKNVREICADVRLIFKNAMKYNNDRDDVHIMAKSLLDRFETKWLQLLPKVDEEEERRKEEEAEMQQDMQLAQEAAYAKMTRELNLDLAEFDTHLEELKDLVLQKCRKMTTEEKKQLGSAITRLSAEDINKALEIIARNDPTFQAAGETVEVDIDAQSESTLWKLKLFVKDTLQLQRKSSTSTGGNNNGDENQNCSNKRKREVPESLAKTAAQKKGKKPPS